MKNFIKAVAVAIAGVLVLSVAPALANPQHSDEEAYANANYYEDFGDELMGTFRSRSGVVTSITDLYGTPGQMIRIEGNNGTTDFRVDSNTFVLGDEIEEGDEITAFYPFGPAIMIYPPQFPAYVIVNGEFDNVMVSRFNIEQYSGELLSADGELQLRFTDDTQITRQDGVDFRAEHEAIRIENEYYGIETEELLEALDGRLLVVVYGPTTRGIPPITIPGQDGSGVKIYVLFERAVHLGDGQNAEIGFGIELPGIEDEITVEPTLNEVVVNGEITELNWIRMLGTYFVPFRAVVDALGFGDTIGWIAETRTIYVSNDEHEIRFSIAQNEFHVNGEIIQLDQAAYLVGNTTYVPFRFFSLVFGMNNAYHFEGQVVIDNEEAMY